MDLIFSDYLAAAALMVSIASAFYSKKQSDLSRIAARNDYRAHLAEKHEKYRAALKLVSDKHKEDVARLSRDAGNALTGIIDLFDQYDTRIGEPRYLRHLVHECSEMIYYAFKGQLGWQSGLNISHRFSHMMCLEDHLEPRCNYFNKGEFRSVFESRYLEDPNILLEVELLKDFHFCNLVNKIIQSTNPEKRALLISEIQEITKPFNQVFKELKPRVSESANYLKDILAENDLEHFQLDESPKLLSRLRYKQATLDTLSNLRLHDIDNNYIDRYHNYISWSIYTCAILHSIQGFHSWGWDSYSV